MKLDWALIRSGAKGAVMGLILVVPVLVYMHKFGDEISEDHARWAEMGSAMSGIYGPVLAVLTFAVLIHQIRLQRQTNKHIFEQAYIQDARADTEFYLSKLAELLESTSGNGVVLRRALETKFARANVDQLKSNDFKSNAYMIEHDFPQVQASWAAFNSVLNGLRAEARYPYELQLLSAQQKAVAMLSYPTCAALDNYLHCLTEGRIAYPYLFSTTLSEGRP